MNKIFKSLLFVPIIFASTNASFAVSASDSQTISGILRSFIDIKAQTEGAKTTTEINPDDGHLLESLISKFRIRTNGVDSQIYLRATAQNSSSAEENAFFLKDGTTYIVLGNITTKPTSAAINDCKNTAPATATNANAIAYPITEVTLDNSGTAEYNTEGNNYNIKIKTGETFATTKVGTQALLNTYSFEDTAGTYQATLTLSTGTI